MTALITLPCGCAWSDRVDLCDTHRPRRPLPCDGCELDRPAMNEEELARCGECRDGDGFTRKEEESR